MNSKHRSFISRRTKKRLLTALLAVSASIALCACGRTSSKEEIYDPYEGMVSVNSGVGTKMWVKKYDDVPVNPFCRSDYKSSQEANDYTFLSGIDVSEHQRDINWKSVKQSGIDFAVIRAGYRGYSEGGLFKDAFFEKNTEGASNAGLDYGLYFFSQAVSPEEAEAEADFVIDLIGNKTVRYPVFFDWERITTDHARTDAVEGYELTDMALAFCRKIESAGFTAGIYSDRWTAYYDYNLELLESRPMWVGALNIYPDFYYEHSIWQQSVNGKVSGINGEVDLDVMFVKKAQQ